MKPDPTAIKNSRRSQLWGQTQLLYKLDDAGEQVVDTSRAPTVLAAIGVPLPLQQATFATAKFKHADSVKQWFVDVLDGVGAGQLTLFIGDGSNYIAAAALRNAVKRAKTVSWYSWHNFTQRYTDSIDRSRAFDSGIQEEVAVAAQEAEEARDEDFRLRYVYEVLAITGFDITDLREFAVPDITSMFRDRRDWGLTTLIAVPLANAGQMDEDAKHFGAKGPLISLFETEGQYFDARQ